MYFIEIVPDFDLPKQKFQVLPWKFCETVAVFRCNVTIMGNNAVANRES